MNRWSVRCVSTKKLMNEIHGQWNCEPLYRKIIIYSSKHNSQNHWRALSFSVSCVKLLPAKHMHINDDGHTAAHDECCRREDRYIYRCIILLYIVMYRMHARTCRNTIAVNVSRTFRGARQLFATLLQAPTSFLPTSSSLIIYRI